MERTPEEWQAIARAVTDPLPPLSDEQRRGLTVVARRYARQKRQEAMTSAIDEAAVNVGNEPSQFGR